MPADNTTSQSDIMLPPWQLVVIPACSVFGVVILIIAASCFLGRKRKSSSTQLTK